MSSVSVSTRYVCNPDVVLREEDDDGGLLFNPDTNQIKVLNHTGLFIWKLCDGSHTFSDVLTALRDSYDGLPDGELESQVETFMDQMVANGFVGR